MKTTTSKKFNYENYGGTPILGLNKTVIIGLMESQMKLPSKI